MNEQLLNLEDRILDLEFKRLKTLVGWERTRITATRSIPATKTEPAKKVPLEMRTSTSPHGAKKHELRTATGWQTLPASRDLWPAELRQMHEQFEAIDKKRRVGGRLISASIGSAGLEVH